MFYQTQTGRRLPKGRKKPVFLSLVTLTFDFQTCPSKGPNTYSMCIWHKSVQQFRRYLVHKQKTEPTGRDGQEYAVQHLMILPFLSRMHSSPPLVTLTVRQISSQSDGGRGGRAATAAASAAASAGAGLAAGGSHE